MPLKFVKNSIGAKFSVTVGITVILFSTFMLWRTWRHAADIEQGLLNELPLTRHMRSVQTLCQVLHDVPLQGTLCLPLFLKASLRAKGPPRRKAGTRAIKKPARMPQARPTTRARTKTRTLPERTAANQLWRN